MQDQIPEGTILVTRNGWEKTLYKIEDLPFLNDLAVGQMFYAVAGFYGRTPESYGARWINYRNHQGDVSKAFTFIQEALAGCSSDLERMNMICDQLGEAHIPLPTV